jgi:hypothetical protein
MKSPEFSNNFKQIIDPIIKDQYCYKTNVLHLVIISFFDVVLNDPLGKNMDLDYYNNNPEPIYNNNKNGKETTNVIVTKSSAINYYIYFLK